MKLSNRLPLSLALLVLLFVAGGIIFLRPSDSGKSNPAGETGGMYGDRVVSGSEVDKGDAVINGAGAESESEEPPIVLDVPRYVNGLIQPIGPAIRNTSDSSVERSMPITIDREELGRMRERIEKGETVTVEMAFFERTGEKLDLDQVEDLEVEGDEGFALKGSFQGQPGSVGVLVDWKGSLAGTAMLYGRGYYRVRTVPSGYQVLDHVVKDVVCSHRNATAFDASVNQSFLVGVPSGYELELPSPSASRSVISLLLCYTDDAFNLISSEDGITLYENPATSSSFAYHRTVSSNMHSALVSAVSFSNSVHKNSGSIVRFEIAGFIGGFNDSNNPNKTVSELLPPDWGGEREYPFNSAEYSRLYEAANDLGVDRISLIMHRTDGDSAGIAYTPSRRRSSPAEPWSREGLDKLYPSVCQVQSMELLLTHELGHTLAANHDRQTLLENNQSTTTRAPFFVDSVGFGFTADGDSGYSTIMGYPSSYTSTIDRKNTFTIPVFSGGGTLKRSDGFEIKLGKAGAGEWDDPISSKHGYDNVATFSNTGWATARLNNGPEVTANQIGAVKEKHWARVDIQNAIHLGFMSDPTSWEKIDQPLSRGEMITILRQAALAFDGQRLNDAPDRKSPPFFEFDADLHGRLENGEWIGASSHRNNVLEFAAKGWIDTENSHYRVNEKASIGEFVLTAWNVFDLPALVTDGLNAEQTFNLYRSEFQEMNFLRPFGDFRILNTSGSGHQGFSRNGDKLRIKNYWQEDAHPFIDQKGVLAASFNTGQGESYDLGYNAPILRSLAAKIMVNLILYKAR